MLQAKCMHDKTTIQHILTPENATPWGHMLTCGEVSYNSIGAVSPGVSIATFSTVPLEAQV